MSKKLGVKSLNALKADLLEAKAGGRSWKGVGEYFTISGGMAFLIATCGYDPKSQRIRKALGLPIFAPAQVCRVHGVVHTTKRCPSDKPRHPRRKVSRWMNGNYQAKP